MPPPALVSTMLAVPAWLLMAVALAACGPGLAERMAAETELRERAERHAVRWVGAEVRAAPGHAVDVPLELRIAEGYYLPAGASADPGIEPVSLQPPRASFVQVERIDLPPQPQLVRFEHRPAPLLCYEGDQQVGVRLRVAPGTPPGRHKLTFIAIWQQCTLHGCSVPRRDGVEVWLEVESAGGGALGELAP